MEKPKNLYVQPMDMNCCGGGTGAGWMLQGEGSGAGRKGRKGRKKTGQL